MSNPENTPIPAVVFVERQRNGFAIAALCLGIVGAVFGLIPLTFIIALACGLVGIGLGIPAVRNAAARGRKVMAWIGLALSVVAIALGSWGAVIVNDASEDLNRDLEKIQRDLDNSQVNP